MGPSPPRSCLGGGQKCLAHFEQGNIGAKTAAKKSGAASRQEVLRKTPRVSTTSVNIFGVLAVAGCLGSGLGRVFAHSHITSFGPFGLADVLRGNAPLATTNSIPADDAIGASLAKGPNRGIDLFTFHITLIRLSIISWHTDISSNSDQKRTRSQLSLLRLLPSRFLSTITDEINIFGKQRKSRKGLWVRGLCPALASSPATERQRIPGRGAALSRPFCSASTKMPSQQDQQTPGLAGSFLPAMMAAVMAEIMGAAAAQITAPSSTPVETINSANSFTPQLKPTTVSPAHSDQHNSKNSRKRHLQEGTRGKANTKEMSTKDVGQLQVSSDAFSNGLPSTSEDKSNEAATDIATDLSTNAQPNESATHKIRKLKLYSVEEKIDIIDYAKVIGNRAAGREFNVAESSIREWRKNEERLRRQIENPENVSNDADQAIIGHHFERANPNVIKDIDAFLIDYVNNNKETVDWYTIRDKANEKWVEIAEKTDEYSQNDMTISMGWVARFMSRCQESIPKVPPPIIATANAAMNAGLGNVSMVRCGSKSGKQSGDENGEEEQKIRKRPKKSSQSKAVQLKTDVNSETPDNSSKDTESVSSGGGFSRRKCRKPMRVENATLLLNNEHVSNHNDLCAADEKAAPKSLNGNAELLDVPRNNVNGIAMDFSQTCNALAAWLMSCNAANGNLIAFADSRK